MVIVSRLLHLARLRLLALLLTIWAALPIAAGGWQVTTWTTENALPQGVVYAIRQTADRYLWFTTLGGLVRYDGVEFTVFAKGATPGLRSNRFTTLLEAEDGTLWAGTEDGFVTRYRDGAFTTYSVDDSLSSVYAIVAKATSHPWVMTGAGLYSFDGTRFVRAGASVRSAAFLYRTGSAAVDDRGVTVLEPGHAPLLFPMPGLFPPGSGRLVIADERSLWIIDATRGIFELRDRVLARVEAPAMLAVVRNLVATSKGTLGAFLRARDGAFWIAHSERGIARVQGSSVEWITAEDGLSAANINRIYEDREGTMWATSSGGGLTALRRHAARTYGAAEGLNPPIAYPILARDGQLLVGSWGGGLYRFDGRRFTAAVPLSGLVTSVADDHAGTLWVALHNAGVVRIRGRELREFGTADGLPSSIIRAIYRSRNGQLWFGTNDGLAVNDGDRFVAYRTTSPQLNLIQAFAEEKDGALLLGTRGGLVRFRDGRFSIVADERSGLSSGTVRAIQVDDDGTIWVGTYDGGLNRLRNGRVTAITTREGLFDNGVFAILEHDGFFWMSSNRGVHRASRRELNAVADGEIRVLSSLALTRGDGLLSAECNGGVQPAAARTADGMLWFPTQQGIVAIDPRLVPAQLTAPPIHVTGISVDGEQRSLSGEVEIAPGSRRLEFRFVAPTMIASRLVRYRYRLEGFEQRWNEVVGERLATYTRVPPGRYRFVVSASSADGRWSETPAATVLRIAPPFWLTWWFRTALVIAGFLLLGSAYWLRMRAVRREQEAQAEFSRRLMIEQEEERRRVASELHDSLGQSLLIIKNRALLGVDRSDAGGAQEQLEEISSTASAAIDEVRRIAHNLRPVELDHFGLTHSLEVLVHRMSASSPILFSGDLDPVDHLLSREAEVNVFRIVQEWLSNVARHSQATAAVVSLRKHGRRLRLRIRDDGAGFSRVDVLQGERAGIGLRSIAERVQMLGGTHEIHSTPGDGTLMTVDVPLPEAP